jgi:hypothetical protein
MHTRVLFALVLSVTACAGQARTLSDPSMKLPDSGSFAIVRAHDATFVFPRIAATDTAWPERNDVMLGLSYQWGVGIDGPQPLSFGFYLDPDEHGLQPAIRSLRHLTEIGQVRQCRFGGHFWTCAWQIAGQATADRGRLVLQIRDSAIVSALRQSRPSKATLYVWRLDESLARDSIPIQYRLPPSPGAEK